MKAERRKGGKPEGPDGVEEERVAGEHNIVDIGKDGDDL